MYTFLYNSYSDIRGIHVWGVNKVIVFPKSLRTGQEVGIHQHLPHAERGAILGVARHLRQRLRGALGLVIPPENWTILGSPR